MDFNNNSFMNEESTSSNIENDDLTRNNQETDYRNLI